MTSELRRPATGRRDVCPEPDGQPEVTTPSGDSSPKMTVADSPAQLVRLTSPRHHTFRAAPRTEQVERKKLGRPPLPRLRVRDLTLQI